MRILHAIASLAAKVGGPAKAVVEMATAVARRGHDVAIYATDYGATAVPLEDARVMAPVATCGSRRPRPHPRRGTGDGRPTI